MTTATQAIQDAPVQPNTFDEAAPPNGLRTAAVATAVNRPRLLIADDDPVVQTMLGMSLCPKFEVVGLAADGEEAIDVAQARQPDAALIDVVMPKGGGLNAVQGIQRVAPNTAIVVLSGHRSNGLVRELMQAGAIEYRHKGVPAQVLVEALTESIKVHIAERRESAGAILSWYCVGLNRRSHRRIRESGQNSEGFPESQPRHSWR
jgi:DNA-binding NarL/FixJ family response regulator